MMSNYLSKYMEMSMDELENEISDKKKKVTAMQKLIEVRRMVGEKSSKQISASKARLKSKVVDSKVETMMVQKLENASKAATGSASSSISKLNQKNY